MGKRMRTRFPDGVLKPPDPKAKGTVGYRIHELRVRNCMTQEQVDWKTGIPVNSLSAYETNKSRLPLDRAVLLSRLYGASVDWIATGRFWREKT